MTTEMKKDYTISMYSRFVEYSNEEYEEKRSELLEQIEKLQNELKSLEAERLQKEISTFKKLKWDLESISDPDPVIIIEDDDDDDYLTK